MCASFLSPASSLSLLSFCRSFGCSAGNSSASPCEIIGLVPAQYSRNRIIIIPARIFAPICLPIFLFFSANLYAECDLLHFISSRDSFLFMMSANYTDAPAHSKWLQCIHDCHELFGCGVTVARQGFQFRWFFCFNGRKNLFPTVAHSKRQKEKEQNEMKPKKKRKRTRTRIDALFFAVSLSSSRSISNRRQMRMCRMEIWKPNRKWKDRWKKIRSFVMLDMKQKRTVFTHVHTHNGVSVFYSNKTHRRLLHTQTQSHTSHQKWKMNEQKVEVESGEAEATSTDARRWRKNNKYK